MPFHFYYPTRLKEAKFWIHVAKTRQKSIRIQNSSHINSRFGDKESVKNNLFAAVNRPTAPLETIYPFTATLPPSNQKINRNTSFFCGWLYAAVNLRTAKTACFVFNDSVSIVHVKCNFFTVNHTWKLCWITWRMKWSKPSVGVTQAVKHHSTDPVEFNLPSLGTRLDPTGYFVWKPHLTDLLCLFCMSTVPVSLPSYSPHHMASGTGFPPWWSHKDQHCFQIPKNPKENKKQETVR